MVHFPRKLNARILAATSTFLQVFERIELFENFIVPFDCSTQCRHILLEASCRRLWLPHETVSYYRFRKERQNSRGRCTDPSQKRNDSVEPYPMHYAVDFPDRVKQPLLGHTNRKEKHEKFWESCKSSDGTISGQKMRFAGRYRALQHGISAF